MASTFSFAEPSGRLDFRSLCRVDYQGVRSSGDVSALQPLLSNVAYSRVTADDIASQPDDAIVAALTFSQLALQYMMHAQISLASVADNAVKKSAVCERDALLARAEAAGATRELRGVRRTLRTQSTVLAAAISAREPTASINAATKSLVFKCGACDKAFTTPSFLESHVQRRHAGGIARAPLSGTVDEGRPYEPHQHPPARDTAPAGPAPEAWVHASPSRAGAQRVDNSRIERAELEAEEVALRAAQAVSPRGLFSASPNRAPLNASINGTKMMGLSGLDATGDVAAQLIADLGARIDDLQGTMAWHASAVNSAAAAAQRRRGRSGARMSRSGVGLRRSDADLNSSRAGDIVDDDGGDATTPHRNDIERTSRTQATALRRSGGAPESSPQMSPLGLMSPNARNALSAPWTLTVNWSRLPNAAPADAGWAPGVGYKVIAGSPAAARLPAEWAKVLPIETEISDTVPPRVRIPRTWQAPLQWADSLGLHAASSSTITVTFSRDALVSDLQDAVRVDASDLDHLESAAGEVIEPSLTVSEAGLFLYRPLLIRVSSLPSAAVGDAATAAALPELEQEPPSASPPIAESGVAAVSEEIAVVAAAASELTVNELSVSSTGGEDVATPPRPQAVEPHPVHLMGIEAGNLFRSSLNASVNLSFAASERPSFAVSESSHVDPAADSNNVTLATSVVAPLEPPRAPSPAQSPRSQRASSAPPSSQPAAAERIAFMRQAIRGGFASIFKAVLRDSVPPDDIRSARRPTLLVAAPPPPRTPLFSPVSVDHDNSSAVDDSAASDSIEFPARGAVRRGAVEESDSADAAGGVASAASAGSLNTTDRSAAEREAAIPLEKFTSRGSLNTSASAGAIHMGLKGIVKAVMRGATPPPEMRSPMRSPPRNIRSPHTPDSAGTSSVVYSALETSGDGTWAGTGTTLHTRTSASAATNSPGVNYDEGEEVVNEEDDDENDYSNQERAESRGASESLSSVNSPISAAGANVLSPGAQSTTSVDTEAATREALAAFLPPPPMPSEPEPVEEDEATAPLGAPETGAVGEEEVAADEYEAAAAAEIAAEIDGARDDDGTDANDAAIDDESRGSSVIDEEGDDGGSDSDEAIAREADAREAAAARSARSIAAATNSSSVEDDDSDKVESLEDFAQRNRAGSAASVFEAGATSSDAESAATVAEGMSGVQLGVARLLSSDRPLSASRERPVSAGRERPTSAGRARPLSAGRGGREKP